LLRLLVHREDSLSNLTVAKKYSRSGHSITYSLHPSLARPFTDRLQIGIVSFPGFYLFLFLFPFLFLFLLGTRRTTR
jgi:hypothetical protein